MDKKKIIVLIFVLLIVCTIVASFLLAIRIYNEEVAEAEKIGRDYRFVWFGAFAMILLGMFVVVYEIDLFYTVYSAAIKPKPVLKTILSILANLCLMLFTAGLICRFLHGATPLEYASVMDRIVDKIEKIAGIAFYMYLPLRLGALIAALVSRKADEKKQKAEA
ncbi:MAG: hypothetical protein II871_02365 [Clostridia bacterium]|nr:hypothetical protein [Clostridia bacterium]